MGLGHDINSWDMKQGFHSLMRLWRRDAAGCTLATTVVGYNAMTELGRISSIIRRVADDSVAAKSEEKEE